VSSFLLKYVYDEMYPLSGWVAPVYDIGDLSQGENWYGYSVLKALSYE